MILAALSQNHRSYVDGVVDDKSLGLLLSKAMQGQSTLDNASTVAHHLKNDWMKACKGFHLSYAGRDTIFNVLLHFSAEVLAEVNHVPICRYEHLLRWHELTSYLSEDLLTTSFLAARDVYQRRKRYIFSWQPVIGHDNRSLNLLFGRQMMDLHFHLNGSSLNFEINWLSLMNRTAGWNKSFRCFRVRQQEVIQIMSGQYDEPLYLCAMKAAVLRMIIFEYLVGGNSVKAIPGCDLNLVERVLSAGTVAEATPYIMNLDVVTQRLRCVHGKRYSCDDGSSRIPDYAVLERHTNGIRKEDTKYALSVLSGERWLMYEMFCDLYAHTNIDRRIVGWFYAYLLYKARFRSEMVQNNAAAGFANFAEYEKRKSLFIKERSVYETLLSQLAVVSCLSSSEDKWLEVRVAPKDKRKDLVRHIRKTRSYIEDRHFVGDVLAKSIRQKYALVLHFIKREDKKSKPSDIALGHCRHYDLRYRIKRQACAIASLRNSLNAERDSILGIDAANSEVYARPEVFAQAFRFLRDCTEELQGVKVLNDLGMTYHAGEDYLDVVDGLRAVDELLLFMGFRDGDRIGHGMVLGVGVREYYSRAHNNIILPAQVLLDNVAWLYCKGKDLAAFTAASKSLEILFETYYQKIYGHLGLQTSIWNYYLSWSLRGDNPQYYRQGNQSGKHRINSKWSVYNLNDCPEVRKAAANPIACRLYEAYHFDSSVRAKGQETVMVHLTDEVVEYIAAVQSMMLSEIERKHIGIECNPTSNLKIGHFDSYSTHPILRMYNDNLMIDEDAHSISVTINTDDKGIFSTSLEREYSLLALSLEKKYVRTGMCSPRVIYKWLDNIRQMSEEQRF